MAAQRKNKKNQATPYRLIRDVVILTVLIMLAISAYKILAVQKKQAELVSRQKELIQERERLSRELLKVEDPKYIEEQARTQLKMVRPGELLYVFNDEDIPSTELNDPKVEEEITP